MTATATQSVAATSSPKDLIPGDVTAILRNVDAIRGRGHTMETVGTALAAVDSGAWTGEAGDAFRDRFSYEPPKWLTAADAMLDTANALEAHATTLDWGQKKALEAIERYQRGIKATNTAREEHTKAQAAANHAAEVQRAAGGPGIATSLPFHDPGKEDCTAAQDMVNSARAQVHESGERAAVVVARCRDTAPESPGFWGEVGGFFDSLSDGLEDIYDGNMSKLFKLLSGQGDTRKAVLEALAGPALTGAAFAITHPQEALAALTDLELWRRDPGRALGQLIPALAMSPIGGTSSLGMVLAGRLSRQVARKTAERAIETQIAANAKKIHAPTPGNGPVVCYPGKDWTPEEVRQLHEYVDRVNQVRVDGGLSETGRVSTKGDVRDEANDHVAEERRRAGKAEVPYQGHAGHVPDSTWTGKGDPPGGWQDLSPRVNQSLGGQSLRYPVGWKPTEFVVGPPR